jgi:hypothetical protein
MANETGKMAVGAGIGSAAGILISDALRSKPAQAGNQFSLDDATKLLIQQIKSNSDATVNGLITIGSKLDTIIDLLSHQNGLIARTADRFGYDNQIIQPGQTFYIINEGSGKGSLVWLLIDIQSPNANISITLDNLQYDFNVAQMILEGLMAPMYPGAWITRADPVGPPPTYGFMFSIGNLEGYEYKNRLIVSILNNNPVAMTLNHSVGIKWLFNQT